MRLSKKFLEYMSKEAKTESVDRSVVIDKPLVERGEAEKIKKESCKVVYGR